MLTFSFRVEFHFVANLMLLLRSAHSFVRDAACSTRASLLFGLCCTWEDVKYSCHVRIGMFGLGGSCAR